MPGARWLIVEDAFPDARGILLRPRIAVASPFRGELEVTLRAPDGGERRGRASLMVSHVRGALAPFAMVRLHGVAVEDVPAGTEIWGDAPL